MRNVPRACVIAAALILAGTQSVVAKDRGITNTSSSPHVKLRSVDLDDVRWAGGFWGEKFQRCRRATIPSMREALLDPGNAAWLNNLRIAAGLEEGRYRGENWSDGDCYKWIESMAHVYAVTKDEKLDQLMEEWIAVIAKAQQPDGYISTNIQLTSKGRLQKPVHHEMYNMGHLLTAACIHHRATGKDNFLALARKTGDFLHKTFSPRPPELVHFAANPSNIMGLVELYRTTGDRKYLEVAQTFVDNRGTAPSNQHGRNRGTDLSQDRVPIREETHAVGHAVAGTYLWCGTADVVAETGEEALLAALDRLWNSAACRRMHITGGVGAFQHSTSARGDFIGECFGKDYQLPPKEAYCESCSNIGNAMWNWRMLTLTGDAKHTGVMERVLYNSFLSTTNTDGTRFFYCNPLQWDGRKGAGHKTGERWVICPQPSSCYCCPPSVARTFAKLQGWAYSVSDEGVWVHLYGGNRLQTELPDGSPVALSQKTAYPWEGRVEITVDAAPDEPCSIMVRIPGWVENATLKINGRQTPVESGTYAALRRKWSAGDRVELDLPMPVRLMEAHPKAKDLHNRVAVMRGPIVYCVETPVDQGAEQVWKDGIFLPENVEFTARHDPDLLGGITVLEGKALTFEGRDRFIREIVSVAEPLAEATDWESTLYRPFRPRKLKRAEEGTVSLTLIPYYVWANRGLSYMQVWTPLAR